MDPNTPQHLRSSTQAFIEARVLLANGQAWTDSTEAAQDPQYAAKLRTAMSVALRVDAQEEWSLMEAAARRRDAVAMNAHTARARALDAQARAVDAEGRP